MSKSCPKDCGDLYGLGEWSRARCNLTWTHGIGVVAQKTTDPWPEPNALADHLKGVYGDEEHQCDGHAHEAVRRAITFELGNE